MKSYTITLTSIQDSGMPDLLNHYIFVDPIEGVSFTYPLTTNGGVFTPYTFSNYISGGRFYPWGYTFQTTFHNISADPLKGPHTIVFSPSSLDTTYYGILKIAYDFGDGKMFIKERDIIPDVIESDISAVDPSMAIVKHDYWPTSNTVTTYNPGISVLNGNLALDVYDIIIRIYPSSVYELGDVKLINTAQHAQSVDETLAVFEVNQPTRFVSTARFFSGGETQYNEHYRQVLFESNDLILNLDASDPTMVVKTNTNNVILWKDKSQYKNNFRQTQKENRPDFLYPKMSESKRKSIRFKEHQALECENNTGFSSASAGYTVCFVMRANEPVGTIFSATTGQEQSLEDTEISQVLMYNRALEEDERNQVIADLKSKWGVE